MNTITIRWLGHAAYKISKGDYSIVLDPFAPGSVPGFRDIRETANEVLCSHGHHDHNYTEAVTLLPETEPAFTVTKIASWHDDAQGTKRGPNTIHILEFDGVRIVHLGDLGCALTQEQAAQLKGADVVLIPVGGFYTINAKEAKAVLEQIKPKAAIPMHYRTGNTGLSAIALLDDFLALYDSHTQLDGDTFIAGEASGIVVLGYEA